MAKRHRKALIVCRACHDGIHIGRRTAVGPRIFAASRRSVKLSDEIATCE
jgi:hypothetical protein